MTPEVNAAELAERLLTYFDSYRIGAVAPIVAELEKALDQEYRRGVEWRRITSGEVRR